MSTLMDLMNISKGPGEWKCAADKNHEIESPLCPAEPHFPQISEHKCQICNTDLVWIPSKYSIEMWLRNANRQAVSTQLCELVRKAAAILNKDKNVQKQIASRTINVLFNMEIPTVAKLLTISEESFKNARGCGPAVLKTILQTKSIILDEDISSRAIKPMRELCFFLMHSMIKRDREAAINTIRVMSDFFEEWFG